MIDVWIWDDGNLKRGEKVKLINIFWRQDLNTEMAAVTKDGDIWYVRAELIEVV